MLFLKFSIETFKKHSVLGELMLAGLKKKTRVVDAEYEKLNHCTLAEWLDYHQREIVFRQVSWMGIPTLKNVMDLWIYQELIWEIKPDIIIEFGSFQGGSTLYLAQLLDHLGKGRVLSVDIDHSRFKAEHHRINILTGSTLEQEIITRVWEQAAAGKVMIIHDADHSHDTVLADLRNYAGLVSRNSYFIVEDGIVDLFPPKTILGDALGGPGPLPAVREFLRENENFVIDRNCERYLLTYNPCGYLKRVG